MKVENSARRPTRRRILAAGAAATTGAWVAPSITRLDRVEAAQPSCLHNFDVSLSGWTIDNTFGTPKNGFWTTGTARTFSSPNSLHWGRNGGANGYSRGTNATSGAATSPSVTMPALGSLPVTFRIWRQVEHQRSNFDVLTLVVIGTTTTQLWQVASIASATPMVGSWTLVSVTVPAAYNGQSVRFRFDFTTVDGANNNFEGVYIDDFRYPC